MKIDMIPLLFERSQAAEIDTTVTLAEVFPSIALGELALLGKVKNSAGHIMLTLQVTGKFTAQCDRCLVDTEHELDFLIEKPVAVAGTIQDDIEEEYIYIEENQLDIMPTLIDAVEFEIPTKILCSDECLGICADCGADLNQSKCSCREKKIDSQWEKIKQMLDE